MRNEKNTVLVKAKTFAIRIVKLFAFLRKEKKDFILSKQILRSGTSIGANLRLPVLSNGKKSMLLEVPTNTHCLGLSSGCVS